MTQFQYHVTYSIGKRDFIHTIKCPALTVEHGSFIIAQAVHKLFRNVSQLTISPL